MFGFTDKVLAMVFGGVSAILLALCAYQAVEMNGFLWIEGVRDKLETATANLNECRTGRIEDRKAYEDAQRQASDQNKAEVARIKAEQESINEKARSDYQRDLARLRAGGLRKDIAAPQGSAGCAGTSSNGEAAAGADGENVCVSRSLLVRAAEIELGRNALIDWITEQLKVVR